MKGPGKLITGVVVGAGAMYLLDPDRGARRRALLRDQGIHARHKIGDGIAATARDTRNRTRGLAAELRGRFSRDVPEDEVLHDRVRSAIGRVVSHPGAVTVTVFEGRVTLTGHVLADELDGLLRQVGRVRGVAEVRNELEMHPSSYGIPALQGSASVPEQPRELAQENWAPATRLVVGSIGGLLALRGTSSSGLPGRLLGVVGLGLLARATSNMPPAPLVGLARGRYAVQVEKTIKVSAPVAQVWELWSNFENFPRFMAHLREVRKVDEGHSHWVAVGPAGVPVEWDAVVTDWVPNQFIGWTTSEGSPIEMTGQVRLRATSEAETEIDVQLAYNPPAGAAGHALASILGSDPRRAIDDDLLRLKSLLEGERTSKPGEAVRLEEVVRKSKAGASRKGAAKNKS